jgi:hypothetical protein
MKPLKRETDHCSHLLAKPRIILREKVSCHHLLLFRCWGTGGISYVLYTELIFEDMSCKGIDFVHTIKRLCCEIHFENDIFHRWLCYIFMRHCSWQDALCWCIQYVGTPHRAWLTGLAHFSLKSLSELAKTMKGSYDCCIHWLSEAVQLCNSYPFSAVGRFEHENCHWSGCIYCRNLECPWYSLDVYVYSCQDAEAQENSLYVTCWINISRKYYKQEYFLFLRWNFVS